MRRKWGFHGAVRYKTGTVLLSENGQPRAHPFIRETRMGFFIWASPYNSLRYISYGIFITQAVPYCPFVVLRRLPVSFLYGMDLYQKQTVTVRI